MPSPNPNETKEEFVARCIPYVKKEKPDWQQEHVVAYCFGIWKENSSQRIRDNAKEIIKSLYGE